MANFDPDFTEHLQTHMQRMTNIITKMTVVSEQLVKLALANPEFLPPTRQVMTLFQDTGEAQIDLNTDMATLLGAFSALVATSKLPVPEQGPADTLPKPESNPLQPL